MVFRSRPDADLVDDAPLVRRIQPLIQRTRAGSSVFFDLEVAAAPVDEAVAGLRAQGVHASVLHVVVAAAARALHERPRLNRFVAGGRLWQRRGVWVTISAKTEKSDGGVVLAMKRQIDPTASTLQIAASLQGVVGEVRSGEKTRTEKELSLLFRLPVFLLQRLVGLVDVLDAWGLLPRWFIDGDPLFSSIFVANLGSLGMDGAQHHLFEYGNTPLFCTIGRKRHAFFVDDAGAVRAREVYPLRFTFDERVEDALYCLTTLQRLQALLEQPAPTT
jgi:pyruvate/2-oxoglutarate dehydrogenase complex dihydrolipoamide acyltransferase (E2) component